MTDIELLKLAAKAAGYDGLGMWDEKHGYLWDGEGWSFDPLRDDGDALRLAVKLEIVVEYRRESKSAFAYNYARSLEVGQNNHDLDPYAATRRAIVLAAAKIGESL